MKKTIAILLSLALILGIASVSVVSAAGESKFTVGGKEYTANIGDKVTYTINMTSPEKIENGQFIIYYPGNVLTIDTVTFGDSIKDASLTYNYTSQIVKGKEIDFNFSKIDENGKAVIDYTSKKMLIEVKFSVTGEGSGDLKISDNPDEVFVCNENDKDITKDTTLEEVVKIDSASDTSDGETVKKKANPIQVKISAKTVKLKKLKKKNQKIKAIKVTKAQGKVTYKITKAAKIKKYLKISSKGVITFKKWKKAKKATYKIKVQINAKGNAKYKAKTVNKIVKVKVK